MSYEDVLVLLNKEYKKSSLSQRDIADKTGMAQANVGLILNGKTQPTPATLSKLLAVFGYEISAKKIK